MQAHNKWLLAALLCAGCKWTFDGTAPPYPLTGNGVDVIALPRLNGYPARAETFVTARDGSQWVAINEGQNPRRGDVTNTIQNPTLHEVRLDGAGDRAFLTGPLSLIGNHALYYQDPGTATMPMATSLHVIDVGDPGAGETYPIDPAATGAALLPDPTDEVFILVQLVPMTTTYDIVRRDGKLRRTLPLPVAITGASGMGMGGGGRGRVRVRGLRFNGDGTWVVSSEMNLHLIAHSTTSNTDVDLGVRPTLFTFDDPREAIVTVGTDGLRRIALDGKTPDVVLDASTMRTDVLVHRVETGIEDALYYAVGDGAAAALWRVPTDGSAPPALIRAGAVARVQAFGPQGQVITSTDAQNTFILGTGDGWLGDWRFMERGLSPQLSPDGAHVYWREHTADDNGAGTLLSAPVPSGATTPLALNSTQHDVLPDGRVLAEENEAYLDFANRLVIVDEKAGVANLLAKGVSAYLLIPNTTDILAEVVTDLNGHDVVRLSTARGQ